MVIQIDLKRAGLVTKLVLYLSNFLKTAAESIILVGRGSGQIKKKEAGASSKSYSKSLKLY